MAREAVEDEVGAEGEAEAEGRPRRISERGRTPHLKHPIGPLRSRRRNSRRSRTLPRVCRPNWTPSTHGSTGSMRCKANARPEEAFVRRRRFITRMAGPTDGIPRQVRQSDAVPPGFCERPGLPGRLP